MRAFLQYPCCFYLVAKLLGSRIKLKRFSNMSKMCVSNYTRCFIGKFFFVYSTTNLEIIFERCKVVGRNKWHSFPMVAEWQRMAFARKLAEWQAETNCHSAVVDCDCHCMPLRAQARMSFNATNQKVFRFPFSAFRFLLSLQNKANG